MGKYTVIIEKGEDGYLIASVVELPGCHTQAKDKPELMSRITEAIELYLEVAAETKGSADLVRPSFIGVETVDVP